MTAKIFRVETMVQPTRLADSAAVPAGGSEQIQLILNEISDIKNQLSQYERASNGALVPAGESEEIEQAISIKRELDGFYAAISETKKEIANLHHMKIGANGVRAQPELDAIVTSTENATNTILEATESIEMNAQQLVAGLTGSQAEMAEEIIEKVVSVFEACNFQDLTGQRIQKIVNVLKYIEDRTIAMMEIWGGVDKFENIDAASADVVANDASLLNGPSLEDDEAVASQDDIDALFS